MSTEFEPAAKKGWLDTPWHADLTALGATLCWAVGYLIYKEVLLHFDPLIAAWGRMFFGLCVYCVVFNKWLLRIARQVRAVVTGEAGAAGDEQHCQSQAQVTNCLHRFFSRRFCNQRPKRTP